MSRGHFCFAMSMMRFQSGTPSPQAQPTGVPVTLPRSEAECAAVAENGGDERDAVATCLAG